MGLIFVISISVKSSDICKCILYIELCWECEIIVIMANDKAQNRVTRQVSICGGNKYKQADGQYFKWYVKIYIAYIYLYIRAFDLETWINTRTSLATEKP